MTSSTNFTPWTIHMPNTVETINNIPFNITSEYLHTKNPFLKELNGLFRNILFDTGIAGGAIRDTILDKIVSDYDVWYIDNLPKTTLQSLGFVFTEVPVNEMYPDNGEWKLTHNALYKGQKVQFMKCKDNVTRNKIIQNFPNSVGHHILYWYNVYISLENHKLWEKSIVNKTIYWKEDVNVNYFDKICTKYSDWHVHMMPSVQPGFWESEAVNTYKTVKKKVVIKKTQFRILNAEKECFKEMSDSW